MTTNVLGLTIENEAEWMLPAFELERWNEDVLGISFEIRGTPGIVVHPECFRAYKEDANPYQTVKVRNRQYDMLYDQNTSRVRVNDSWQTMYLEAFVKANMIRLEYVLKLFGTGEVAIRNIRTQRGGFPDHPVVQGAPYPQWINNLKAHTEYEREVGELKSERRELPSHILPYLELSPCSIYELVPDRRGLGKYAEHYGWDPRKPDILIDRTTGEPVRYEEEFPVSGYDEVIGPSGEKWIYPYHKRPWNKTLEEIFTFVPSYPGPDDDDLKRYYDPQFEKIYLDRFMVSTRMECFQEAARILAEYYHTTGDMEAGIRAAVILLKLARSVPHWPIFGKPDWNYHYILAFFDPDEYERWFAWIADTHFWQTPATGAHLKKMLAIFEPLKSPIIWKQVSELGFPQAREDVIDGILHIVRMSLRFDAYYRTDIWRYFHNTIGLQLNGLVMAALSIGCPEIIHYVIGKAKAAFGYLFMADGMFPESVSYLHDVAGDIDEALRHIRGYSDPLGYTSQLDDSHIEYFDPEHVLPGYKHIMYLCKQRMFYPDGSVMTIHDTWAESQYSQYHQVRISNEIPDKDLNRRNISEPFLLPDFGHAIIGSGEGTDCAEGHLHYSGHWNHSHEDMLNFTLWAHGDELVSDIGYSHLGGYIYTAAAHNLVVVDGNNQAFSSEGGNLLHWHSPDGRTMVMQAEAPHIAYPEARKYRRAVIGIPIAKGRSVFLDLFEVSGGNRHEWMANGCADYSQTAEMTLQPDRYLDNLDDNGISLNPEAGALSGEDFNWEGLLPRDEPGGRSHYYGAFSNVSVYRDDTPWQITMTPAFPHGELFPGAGARAASAEPKPGLRLHWLAPAGGEVMLCEAPRHRYHRELANLQEATLNWNQNVMPKVIVRRDGSELDSTFVALWEPFQNETFVQSCERMDGIAGIDGEGVRIRTEDTVIQVLYRKSETSGPLVSGPISMDGSFLIIKEKTIAEADKETEVDFYSGVGFSVAGLKMELNGWTSQTLVGTGEDENGYYLSIRGDLSQYPEEYDKQPHKGKYIIVAQDGQSNRHLPFDKLQKGKDGLHKIYMTRRPGFTFEENTQMLKEVCSPYRILTGKAKVSFPTEVNMRIREKGNERRIMVRTDAHSIVAMPLDSSGFPCRTSGGSWTELLL
ncbi:heparinase II/III domain-containing protein [Paenibacillus agaridevorans]|uniref:heparinase II/III domain-containing protein n=1 Tax=Paenibacillus agaridevorans TaxID=171404 RepID=UPI001BE4AB1E|nr:heparinase II/III family protein [Paenibacillus agaridevorans]